MSVNKEIAYKVRFTSKLFLFLLFIFICSGFFLNMEKTHIHLMWQVHPSADEVDLDFLSDNGINVIQSFSFFRAKKKNQYEFLELLGKYHMQVIPYIGGYIKKHTVPEGCKLANNAKEILSKLQEKGGIYAWHAFDEPYFTNYSEICQEDVYNQLKEITPSIPVMISFNAHRDIHYKKNFTLSAADILEFHYYSNPYPGAAQLRLLKLARENAITEKDSRIVIVSLRAFNSLNSGRLNMTNDSLMKDYEFAFKTHNITKNIGFYGWDLAPNLGLKKNPYAMKQFLMIMNEH